MSRILPRNRWKAGEGIAAAAGAKAQPPHMRSSTKGPVATESGIDTGAAVPKRMMLAGIAPAEAAMPMANWLAALGGSQRVRWRAMLGLKRTMPAVAA